HPDENRDRRFVLVSLHSSLVRQARPALLMLSGAVAFVLLIACANVANLLLARAAAREREIAIRASLGAGRWRPTRPLLVEGVLLAVLGGAAGLLVASWAVDALLAGTSLQLHGLEQVGIDGGVLTFTAALSLLAGIVFSLAPALHAVRPDLQHALREGPRAAG